MKDITKQKNHPFNIYLPRITYTRHYYPCEGYSIKKRQKNRQPGLTDISCWLWKEADIKQVIHIQDIPTSAIKNNQVGKDVALRFRIDGCLNNLIEEGDT